MKSWMRRLPWVLGVSVLLIAIGIVTLMILNGPKPHLSNDPTEPPTEDSTEPPVADPVRQEMQEGVSFPDIYDWSPYMSGRSKGLKLAVELTPMQEGAKITFEIKVAEGTLLQDPGWPVDNRWKQAVMFDHFTAENGKVFYWNPKVYWFDENDKLQASGDNKLDFVYVDIIVRENENIVGFAVVKIWLVDEVSLDYRPTVVKNIRYPMVNGKYQNVVLKTVKNDIARAKWDLEQTA